MILLSVIVPIYKVEDYLPKCIDSVLQQEFENFELILVDDGSPDACPQICDDYAKRDSRIKVIHKPNGGLSDARNVGIKASEGRYLMFLDADDYIEMPNSFNNIALKFQEGLSDVILYGTKDVNLDSGIFTITRGNYDLEAIHRDRFSAISSLIKTGQFPGSAWVVAIKREFVIKFDLYFIKGLKSEDIDWLMNVFDRVENIDAVTDSFYMYIKSRPGAITSTAGLVNAKDVLFSVNKWFEKFKSNLTPVNELLLSYLAYQYLTSLIIYSNLASEERNQLRPLIYAEKGIIKYLRGRKGLFAKYTLTIFGIEGSSRIFRSINKLNNKFPRLKKLIYG